MKITTLLRVFFGAAFTLMLTQAAQAQGPGTGGPAPGSPADPTAVPIDGGASLLLAGGAAYGLRKLQQRRAAK